MNWPSALLLIPRTKCTELLSVLRKRPKMDIRDCGWTGFQLLKRRSNPLIRDTVPVLCFPTIQRRLPDNAAANAPVPAGPSIAIVVLLQTPRIKGTPGCQGDKCRDFLDNHVTSYQDTCINVTIRVWIHVSTGSRAVMHTQSSLGR